MTAWERFWIGGGGALLPVVATLLAVDLGSMIDHYRDYTFGAYVGTAIRYALLFILGGVVASLNYDEVQPIKLVQLGIAAPALVASYVNAAQVPKTASIAPTVQIAKRLPHAFNFVSTAQAEEVSEAPVVLAGDFLSNVLLGIQGPAAIQRNAAANAPIAADATVSGAAPATANVELERQRSALNAKILDLSSVAQKSSAAAEVALRNAKEDAAAVAAEAGEKLTPELTAAARRSASAAEVAAGKAAADARAVQAAAAALHRLGSAETSR